jgi:uncharacterized protein (TIGR03437 family)
MHDNDAVCGFGFSRRFISVIRLLAGVAASMFVHARATVMAAALFCLVLPGSLAATDWTLVATFADNGTLTGTFALNNGTVSNWNVVASSGSGLPAFTYTPSNSTASYTTDSTEFCTGPCLTFVSNQLFENSATFPLTLELSFQEGLSGGTVNMFVGTDGSDDPSNECLDCYSFQRFFTQGYAAVMASTGTQPANTTAYVQNEYGNLVSVTAGVATSLGNSECECFMADLARDTAGNFVAAGGYQLNVYNSAGSLTSTIQPYDNSAYFASVAVDAAGNYIVLDSNYGKIYKISPGAPTNQTVVAVFPTESYGYVRVDSSGNYILALTNYVVDQEDQYTFSLFRITPPANGTASCLEVPTNGCVAISINAGDFTAPTSTGGLTFDASGNYVNVDWNSCTVTCTIYTITPSGTTTPLYTDTNHYLEDPEGIYRDTLSGLFFLVDDETNALYTLSANGSNLSQIASGGVMESPGSLVVVDVALPPAFPQLSITTSELPNGIVGTSYGTVGFGATGGSGSYAWSVSGLPAGLSANSSGVVTGTPTAAGVFPVTASVSDSVANMSAQESFTLSVAYGPLSISGPANLGGIAPSAAVSAAYTGSSGKPPYTYSAIGLPVGLTINPSSGNLSGSIGQPGNYNFTVRVSDSEPVTTSLNVSLFVLGITTTSLPAGTNKIAYSQTLAATGGNPPPYSWSVTAGTLPTGLTLASSGVLSGTPVLAGTPTSAQTFPFTVSVTSGGVTVSEPLSLTVTLTPQPLTIPGGAGNNPIVLASGPVQVAYSQALEAAGGIPPYSWSLLAGALPDGLSLSSAGTISGTPTKISSFGFTAQATDTSGATAAAGFSITITPPVITITTTSPLSNGIAGISYPTQVFAATGGIGPYTFQEQGALPSGLTFSGGQITGVAVGVGTSSFTVTATDSSQPTPLTASSEFQISVSPAHTDLVLSQGSLPFTFNAGAISLPAGTSTASISVSSDSTQALGYSVNVSPAVTWLDVTAGSGVTPGIIGVSLDPKALAMGVGTFQTGIVVNCAQSSPCAGDSQTINVTLNVVSTPPQLVAGPNLLSFAAQTGSTQTSAQALILQNAGGGTITVNSVTTGNNFVTFSGIPSTIPANGTVPVSVIVNPSGLAAGYYESTILVNTSVGSADIPVILLVSANATMTLNPSGTQFQMLAGSAPGQPNGSFLVGVNSTSAVNWNATVQPGASWLQLNTTSGSSTSANPGTVSFSINPAVASTLTAQAYYGTIQVTSGSVTDSPQNFLVVLSVAAAGTSIQPDPVPSGLLFTGAAGTALPPQTVEVFSSSLSAVGYAASSDSPWLSVTVGAATTSSASPGFSQVSVNQSGLTPGVYRGNVTYQFTGPGTSSAVRAVSVTLIVEGAGAVPAAREGATTVPASGTSTEALPQQSPACAPTQLVPTQTGLPNSFAQPASWPTPLNVLVTDNCANPIANGQVVVTFSNGDAPLELSPVNTNSGNYSGTWTPHNAAAQITILARASATGFPAATAQIAGQVTPNATPVLSQNGTLNAFAPLLGAAVAPGTIVQIYGSNLAAQPASATTIPLPSKLNATSVLIGGMLAPLYYVSPGQINAQVPFELAAGNQYQVIVNANGALSTPNPIQLSSVAPGVLGFATGQIIATHLNGSLVLETTPAAPGEVIVFYVAGMGLTNQNVPSGTASPSTNLAMPLVPPTLTLGGIAVTNVLFSGLTPTLVGLYQVDFQVPATAPNGDLQLVMTQANGESNTTVIPVHN